MTDDNDSDANSDGLEQMVNLFCDEESDIEISDDMVNLFSEHDQGHQGKPTIFQTCLGMLWSIFAVFGRIMFNEPNVSICNLRTPRNPHR